MADRLIRTILQIVGGIVPLALCHLISPNTSFALFLLLTILIVSIIKMDGILDTTRFKGYKNVHIFSTMYTLKMRKLSSTPRFDFVRNGQREKKVTFNHHSLPIVSPAVVSVWF